MSLAPITDPSELLRIWVAKGGEIGEGVYLIHLDSPLSHARHYLGYSPKVSERVQQHLTGHKDSSPMLKAALQRGIGLSFVAFWPDRDRSFERRLKDYKNVARYCPLCAERTRDRANILQKIRRDKKRHRQAALMVAADAWRKELESRGVQVIGQVQVEELPEPSGPFDPLAMIEPPVPRTIEDEFSITVIL